MSALHAESSLSRQTPLGLCCPSSWSWPALHILRSEPSGTGCISEKQLASVVWGVCSCACVFQTRCFAADFRLGGIVQPSVRGYLEKINLTSRLQGPAATNQYSRGKHSNSENQFLKKQNPPASSAEGIQGLTELS